MAQEQQDQSSAVGPALARAHGGRTTIRMVLAWKILAGPRPEARATSCELRDFGESTLQSNPRAGATAASRTLAGRARRVR